MQEIAKKKETRKNTKPTNHLNCDDIMHNKIKHFNTKIKQNSKNKALKATKDGTTQMEMKHSNIKNDEQECKSNCSIFARIQCDEIFSHRMGWCPWG
jgi:hypothetical protein